MGHQYVLTESKQGIGRLTLNRPEKLNAIMAGMREEIVDALAQFARDSDTRVVIITGAGRAFCAGGDIGYLAELLEKKSLDEFRALLEFGNNAVRLIRQMPKPVMAAVNGPAAGAGLNLAIACDIRLASHKASFGASFSKIGLHPDWGGSWFLPRLVGSSRALELVFTGEMIGAAEAERIGLVNHVYSDEAFPAAVDRMAETLAARPPRALALAKTLLWEAGHQGMDAVLARELENQMACFQSQDAWEGIHAFLEKRQPAFSGV